MEKWLLVVIPVLLTALLGAIGALLLRLRKNERDIVELQTKVSPFWASIQTKVADALHQPDIQHADTDNLLEKLEARTITPKEQKKLERKLESMVSTAPTDVAEKAHVLLTVMPLVVQEKAGTLPDTDKRSMKEKK
jgi:hypothetical protein